MNFYKGMRRATFVLWVVVSIFAFFISLKNYDVLDAVSFGYAIGVVAIWSGFFWLCVFVVRWIWLGFVTKDEAPLTAKGDRAARVTDVEP